MNNNNQNQDISKLIKDIDVLKNEMNKMSEIFSQIARNVEQQNKKESKNELLKSDENIKNDLVEEKKESSKIKWIIAGIGVAIAGAAGAYLVTRNSKNELESGQLDNNDFIQLSDNTLKDNSSDVLSFNTLKNNTL